MSFNDGIKICSIKMFYPFTVGKILNEQGYRIWIIGFVSISFVGVVCIILSGNKVCFIVNIFIESTQNIMILQKFPLNIIVRFAIKRIK